MASPVHDAFFAKPMWLVYLLSHVGIHRAGLGCAPLQLLGPDVHPGNRKASWRRHRWHKDYPGNAVDGRRRCHLRRWVWAKESLRGRRGKTASLQLDSLDLQRGRKELRGSARGKIWSLLSRQASPGTLLGQSLSRCSSLQLVFSRTLGLAEVA